MTLNLYSAINKVFFFFGVTTLFLSSKSYEAVTREAACATRASAPISTFVSPTDNSGLTSTSPEKVQKGCIACESSESTHNAYFIATSGRGALPKLVVSQDQKQQGRCHFRGIDSVVAGSTEDRSFGQADLLDWHQKFIACDLNDSELLEQSEIIKCLSSYAANVAKKSAPLLKQLALQFDVDADDAWDVAEFVSFASSYERGILQAKVKEFMMYDVESKGYLTLQQAYKALLDIYKDVSKDSSLLEFQFGLLDPVDARSLIDNGIAESKLKAADDDNDDKIQFHEYQMFYVNERKETEIALTFKLIDQDKNDQISRREVVDAYSEQFPTDKQAEVFDLDEINLYMRTFSLISELHGRGEIEKATELLEEYQSLMSLRSNRQLAEIFSAMDIDKSGKIDYQEFKDYFVTFSALETTPGLIVKS